MAFMAQLRKLLGLNPEKAITEASANDKTVDTIVAALGGLDNIRDVYSCISRLRLSIHDMDLVDEKLLKSTDCFGLIPLGPHKMHVVYGLKANLYSENIQRRLDARG